MLVGGRGKLHAHEITAAQCRIHRLAVAVFHVFNDNVLIAVRGDQLQPVADSKLVFNVDFSNTGFAVIGQDLADKRLLPAF